ncbi:MAG: ABC transporter ATP-binding protein [Granulosicoccus sp.]
MNSPTVESTGTQSSGAPEAAVSIRQIEKRYGDFTALKDIVLDIQDNEFFTLLGPSGCGKTSLLRIIAGFEATSAGRLFLYGEEIENLPPHKRPINTVFQNYSLFPHMNVSENIGFGLQMLGWPSEQITARIAEMVSLVRLEEFVHRKPSQLSGGQQQRVALARAMAPKPKVLLLDEPLSALDLKLRQQMRTELKALQRNTGITFVFVTHDQEEALSMSDRIAVMSAGRIQQVGTPADIYEKPANRFIADFIGDTNLIQAEVIEMADTIDSVMVRLDTGGVIRADCTADMSIGQKGVVSLRPERLHLQAPTSVSSEDNSAQLHGVISDVVYLGTDRQYCVAISDSESVTVRTQNIDEGDSLLQSGARISVNLTSGAARFLVN